jgi:hypothetical protein
METASADSREYDVGTLLRVIYATAVAAQLPLGPWPRQIRVICKAVEGQDRHHDRITGAEPAHTYSCSHGDE